MSTRWVKEQTAPPPDRGKTPSNAVLCMLFYINNLPRRLGMKILNASSKSSPSAVFFS